MVFGMIIDCNVSADCSFSLAVSWVYLMIICIHNVDVFPAKVISFMSVPLMSIQIDNHYFAHPHPGLQVVSHHCDIRVNAKPSSLLASCVMVPTC